MDRLRLVSVALLLVLVSILSGCWDHREVEDLGIVLLTALDLAPGNKIRVEVQTLVPGAVVGGGAASMGMGGGGGGRKRYLNLVAEDRTVFEAIRRMSLEASRELFFAHNQVILISEKLAREKGVTEIIDFFARNRQFRRDTWFLVVRGDPRDIMEIPTHLETTPAQVIMGIINRRDLSSYFAPTKLGEFIEMLESTGIEPYTAILQLKPNPAFTRISLLFGVDTPPPSLYRLWLAGAAVFRQGKMVGQLSERETRGLLWVRGEVRGGPITIALPASQGKQELTMEILRFGRGGVKLEPYLAGGRLGMKVRVSVRVNLAESQNLQLDLNNPRVISRLEKEVAGVIKGEIMACVTRLQEEYRTDALGFGQAVHRKYPRVWRQVKGEWEDVFATMPVAVEVKTVIRRIGLINNPTPPHMLEVG
ncbi:MAG: Ger(x)C family spore germination protein [Thermoanaerobacter sp.]|nr:Ger(x)C family spore germination protein [Thermoanaerobacter sp.]